MRPSIPTQKQYEALKAFYVEELSATEVAKKFQLSRSYFKKIQSILGRQIQNGVNPFFIERPLGPQKRRTKHDLIQRIVMLRKQNYAITDIQACLQADKENLSLNAIDQILKDEGFAPLLKRTRQERLSIQWPQKLEAPRSQAYKLVDEQFATEMSIGPILFLPLIQQLKIVDAIQYCGFPKTKDLSDVQMVLSFLALKLLGNKRWSYDSRWNLDRALGLFAGLNVLPKATTLSTYSYRVNLDSNRKLLLKLSQIFESGENSKEFNLDFKAIPYWGDASVLEKNWCGSRSKAMKSLLALIVQNPETQNLSYTNATLRHRNQNKAVLEFVDFWKEGHGVKPKMLIFDSRFTTYEHLNLLNKDDIKFLTLRRRGKRLIKGLEKIPKSAWQTIRVERNHGKFQTVKVHESRTVLKRYEGEVREIILTDHGRSKPAFLITNDFTTDIKELIKKYARRWLVEQEIAEQILFFHLNNPASSVVVKVDFDLTLSLLAHNLYRKLAQSLPGFEHCNVDTLCRKFLENGAKIVIQKKEATVCLKKKTHVPILLQAPWLKEVTSLPWLGIKLRFDTNTVS